MSDPRARLTATEVREAGLADWRLLGGQIRARFHTGDFATGMGLVNAIADAAERADHHPDVSITYGEVIVSLSSHDVHGITSRDLDLALEVSALAAARGLTADVTGLTQLDIGLDTGRGAALAPFYAALLGSTLLGSEPVDPTGQVPTIWWQDQHDLDPDYALPDQPFEQRWHFDVWVPEDDAPRRLQAVLDAGGRLVSDRGAPSFWVIEDADGNRSCICTTVGR
jgi:4a-hydroxytetrahydrobiopterin dehydratase